MAPKQKSDDVVLDLLCEVFREHGYDGASLTRISTVTGLQRSSLYHRFPGGKEEMAVAVIQHVGQHLGEFVLAPLMEAGDPAAKVRRVGKRLIEFFGGGRKACLLDTMTVAENPSRAVAKCARDSYEAWAGSFAGIAREAGFGAATARRRAEEALIQLEGALVVARVQDNPAVFSRAVAGLPALLTG